jgi:hypothetical protein
MLIEKNLKLRKVDQSRKSTRVSCRNETKSSHEEVQVDKSLTWSTRLLYFGAGLARGQRVPVVIARSATGVLTFQILTFQILSGAHYGSTIFTVTCLPK